ncbi:hypothetical protein [Lactobacillus amylovorus]
MDTNTDFEMKGQIQLRNKEHFHDYNYKDNEKVMASALHFNLEIQMN